jgi:multiple sugar transport system permease protein
MTATQTVPGRRSGLGDLRPAKPARRLPSLTMAGLLLPSLVLLIVLNVYPLLFAISQSVHNGNLLQRGRFIGLANYTRVLTDDRFWHATAVTMIFSAAGVFGSALLGLLFALAFRAGMPGAKVLRIVLLLPWITPAVVGAATWQWLISTPSSPARIMTRWLGMGEVLFLADATLALVTLCAFRIWVSFPFMLLMSSAALEGIDRELYEAARVDGASSPKQFLQITWPLIKKPTYISLLLMTIFTVNDFGSVYLLTGGGPAGATMTLPVLSYLLVFREFLTGPGVAVATLLSVALVILSVVLYRMIRKVD